MAYKSPLPQPGQTAVIELNENLEALFPETARETAVLSALDHYPPALREMLESNDYQVALVSRSESAAHIRGSQAEPFSATPPAVLLAFTWKELVAQVSEFVRDSNAPPERKVARFGDLCVDFANMEVTRSSGETITLANQEFKTLKCFLRHPNRVFSRDELLNEAWGYEHYPSTRTVDNHVSQLRKKLERDPAHPVHFRTVYRVGYKFVP